MIILAYLNGFGGSALIRNPVRPFFIFDTMMIPRQQQLFIFSGNLARGQGMDGLTDADAAAAVLALRPSFMVGGCHT